MRDPILFPFQESKETCQKCLLSEILRESALWLAELALYLIKSHEFALQIVIKLHDGSNVSATVTIVRGGPNGHEILLGEVELISLLHELVSAADQREVVNVVELIRDEVSEEPSRAAWRNGPCLTVIRIGPHEVAELALMRDLLPAIDRPDLVTGADFR